jgi:hypothetical protein
MSHRCSSVRHVRKLCRNGVETSGKLTSSARQMHGVIPICRSLHPKFEGKAHAKYAFAEKNFDRRTKTVEASEEISATAVKESIQV